MPVEKQLEVIRRAEKQGPRPDDPDWLLLETMMACAARMEAVAPMTEKSLAAFAETLEQVSQRVDDLAKLAKEKAPAARPPAPAIPAEVVEQIGRIEKTLSGVKTDQRHYSFVRDCSFWIGGVAVVLAVQWMLAAQHIVGQSWLIWRCLALGAALVVLVLFAAIKIEQLRENCRR
jgi:hypothetical protein